MSTLSANTLFSHSRYIIPIPGGAKANIFIVEDLEGNPHEVICSIGKVGTTMSGSGTTIARLLSSIIRETSLDEAIGLMSEISLDIAESHEVKYENEVCRSLTEAFTIALRKYRSLNMRIER